MGSCTLCFPHMLLLSSRFWCPCISPSTLQVHFQCLQSEVSGISLSPLYRPSDSKLGVPESPSLHTSLPSHCLCPVTFCHLPQPVPRPPSWKGLHPIAHFFNPSLFPSLNLTEIPWHSMGTHRPVPSWSHYFLPSIDCSFLTQSLAKFFPSQTPPIPMAESSPSPQEVTNTQIFLQC